ncbi:MAG: efflux RND transporter periplasmic adaptor subunit [Clostridia bacterium]|nr:efflux RND transporter periplasmic adaptor subunit [Clostridia bacterium]
MFKRLDPVRRKTGKALIAFLLVMAVLTLINNILTEMTVPVVRKASPQRGALEKRFNATGTVEADIRVPLYAESGSRVARVYVRTGQQVFRGDPLIALDVNALADGLADKQAAYDQAKQNLDWAFADVVPSVWRRYEQAQKNLQRSEEAYEKAVSKEDKETRASAVRDAEDTMNKITEIRDYIQKLQTFNEASDALEKARWLLENPVCYAPEDAVITTVQVSEGDAVSSAALLTWAGTDTPMSLTVTLSGDDVTLLQVGDNAQIGVSGKSHRVPILTAVENEDGLEVSFLLPEGAGYPGVTAEVSVSKRTQNYDLLIPLTALRQDSYGYYVLLLSMRQGALGTETTAVRRDVTVLDTDATRAALQGGVSFNDSLIARSDRAVSEGDRVRVQED